jgi:hypothetical protein
MRTLRVRFPAGATELSGHSDVTITFCLRKSRFRFLFRAFLFDAPGLVRPGLVRFSRKKPKSEIKLENAS